VKGWNVAIQQINQHMNRFPLIGAHATLDCDSCHKSAASASSRTVDHVLLVPSERLRQYKTTGLDHVKLNLPTGCEQCHTMDNWMGAKFDHLQFTGCADGAHATWIARPATWAANSRNTGRMRGCHLADFNRRAIRRIRRQASRRLARLATTPAVERDDVQSQHIHQVPLTGGTSMCVHAVPYQQPVRRHAHRIAPRAI